MGVMELADRVATAVHLTAEEAQAIIEGAIGDVQLNAAKVGNGGLSALIAEFNRVGKGIPLEQVDEFIAMTAAKISEKVKSKFGDLDAESAGATVKSSPNVSEMDEFQKMLNVTLRAAIREQYGDPSKQTGKSM